ncbi:hypothetical protein [Methanolapillus ohkumae]|uniref:Pterin-binding domain-containing protein n=1 Tax=Methanolapillus ohkumae TaxID=3028298 RepID=A0AA96VEI2_9EURY|nr:hypothetical protein MsAm2_06320 [Methanosarcinaceae archaeon Am2]
MKILVVTGQLAFETVQKAISDTGADLLMIQTPVASLITPQKLAAGFISSPYAGQKYDAVLISGFSKFDFKRAEKEIGSPVFLGPKQASDLNYILKTVAKNADSFSFSKEVPACEFLQKINQKEAFLLLEEYEQKSTPAFQISNVAIGGTSSLKVLGEIVNAEDLSFSELEKIIRTYISAGADIIDLGFSLHAGEKDVFQIVSFAKSVSTIPISVDSGDFFQIAAGIKAGADLILSLNSDMLQRLFEYMESSTTDLLREQIKKTAFVILPDFEFSNSCPSNSDFPESASGFKNIAPLET